MAKLQQMRGQGVGLRSDERLDLPSFNHFKSASVTAKVAKEIKAKGLRRVAGNAFICSSTKDLWKVVNGKLIRLMGSEVDNGEMGAIAPAEDPRSFLKAALDDLTW